jgi:hypothetical protein
MPIGVVTFLKFLLLKGSKFGAYLQINPVRPSAPSAQSPITATLGRDTRGAWSLFAKRADNADGADANSCHA